MVNPIYKWMMTGGTPIYGNHHVLRRRKRVNLNTWGSPWPLSEQWGFWRGGDPCVDSGQYKIAAPSWDSKVSANLQQVAKTSVICVHPISISGTNIPQKWRSPKLPLLVEAIQEADVSKCAGAPQKLIADGDSQGRERDKKLAFQTVENTRQDNMVRRQDIENWDDGMLCICFTRSCSGGWWWMFFLMSLRTMRRQVLKHLKTSVFFWRGSPGPQKSYTSPG